MAEENHLQRLVPLNGSSDSPAPLAGTIICCTSVPEEHRAKLAEYSQQMGATHRYDLTLDVTHLIVGDHDTPKYRYVAKERPDVKVMTTGWIEAVRKLWIEDAEIDLEFLEKKHTLPTLNSLKFSMTGCDNPEERSEIAEQVRANGGIYEGDLTKQITHLISFRTDGAKYKAARNWNIRVVSIEWLHDSLERGMMLDDKLYDPLLPAEERGVGAWNRSKPKRVSLGKRLREDSISEGGKRKLRRTASMKLNSQSQNLWGDIVGGGIITEVARSGVWENTEPAQPTEPPRQERPVPTINTSSHQPIVGIKAHIQGIFSCCLFYFHGFDTKKVEVLCNYLLPQGAEVANSLEDLCSITEENVTNRLFMLVPHELPMSELPQFPESQSSVEKITDWWVERCLHSKSFIDPSEHVIGRPFPVFPIPEFVGMTICSSAFSGIDLRHFTNSVKLLGATYSEDLTPQCSILVTKSRVGLRKDKFEHARDWNIPIVSAEWLWECIAVGTRVQPKKNTLRSQKRSGSLPNTAQTSLSEVNNQSGLKRSLAEEGSPRTKSLPVKMSEKPPHPESNISLPKKVSREPSNSEGNISASVTVDDLATIKEEQNSLVIEPEIPASDATTQDLSYKLEPLSERDPNSPSKAVLSTSVLSRPRQPREDISNAISDLLAKTKTGRPFNHGSSERKPRGANRILGRAMSNVSAASSVDSTATVGNAVEYPKDDNMAMLINGDKNTHMNRDSQPPSTQIGYEDPISNEVNERVMAKMKGEALPKRKGTKEKAVTVGNVGVSLEPRTRATRTGRGAR